MASSPERRASEVELPVTPTWLTEAEAAVLDGNSNPTCALALADTKSSSKSNPWH